MNKVKKINNKKINRKGMEGSAFTWIAGALGLMLAILLAWMLWGKSSDAVKSTDVFLSMNDYDGDGTKDVMDACPCGTDNVKQEINGKAYCLAGLNQAQCQCANEFANSALKSETKSKYKAETFFAWNSEAGKCLYMKDAGCKYLIYADEKSTPNAVGSCPAIP